jgi:hypothetical protein
MVEKSVGNGKKSNEEKTTSKRRIYGGDFRESAEDSTEIDIRKALLNEQKIII